MKLDWRKFWGKIECSIFPKKRDSHPISGLGGSLGGRESSNLNLSTILLDPGLILPAQKPDAKIWDLAYRLSVLLVHATGHIPQILDPVVRRVPVNVVNLVLGPRTVDQGPYGAVDENIHRSPVDPKGKGPVTSALLNRNSDRMTCG
jgi:hypothetical protein